VVAPFDQRNPGPAERDATIQRIREHALRLPLAERFAFLHREGVYATAESVSGPGSELGQTEAIRRELPPLLRDLAARRILDAPCGDCNWMARVDLGSTAYVGVDIVEELVARNQKLYGPAGLEFARADITRDELPQADVILCRDALIHFETADVWRTLVNFARTGSHWLLSTSFVERDNERDIASGDFRPINLLRPPFNLAAPTRELDEACRLGNGAFPDKRLLLWPMSAVSQRLAELAGVERATGRSPG
jgi:SAM-dependent methyltransferase